MYKKIALAFLVLPCIALAEERNSVTLGYAHGLQGGFKKTVTTPVPGTSLKNDTGVNNGINVKYRYEINDNVGVISSLTYMKQSANSSVIAEGKKATLGKFSLTQTSFSMGPSYRFNEYISLYGTVGATQLNGKFEPAKNLKDVGVKKVEIKKLAPVYSLGLQINPVKNSVSDASLERRARKGQFADQTTGIIGVGYRF